jgi:hypothetical protein
MSLKAKISFLCLWITRRMELSWWFVLFSAYNSTSFQSLRTLYTISSYASQILFKETPKKEVSGVVLLRIEADKSSEPETEPFVIVDSYT